MATGTAPDAPTDRVWLITGCSSGFGRELALAAIDAGDRVMATARRQEQLADLVIKGGDRVHTASLDVTDAGAIDATVQATIAAFGHVDVVVNNAGHGSVGAVEEMTMAELRVLMEVVFFGAVQLTKAVLPHLRRRGRGAIVQMSSMGGQLTMPGFGGYCAAKFALEGISEALAAEVAPFGVRVLIVEPGAFRTGFGGPRMHRSREIEEYRVSAGPTRAAVDAMDGRQPGDPAKAARTILRVLDSDHPPLRLALGDDAVTQLRAHQRRLGEELDHWAAVSAATDLDAVG